MEAATGLIDIPAIGFDRTVQIDNAIDKVPKLVDTSDSAKQHLADTQCKDNGDEICSLKCPVQDGQNGDRRI
jgi:hypothetical protein